MKSELVENKQQMIAVDWSKVFGLWQNKINLERKIMRTI